MVKKISLYNEETTNTVCAILEFDGDIYNMGPVTAPIVKEYTDMGYVLDFGDIFSFNRPQLEKEYTDNGFELTRS